MGMVGMLCVWAGGGSLVPPCSPLPRTFVVCLQVCESDTVHSGILAPHLQRGMQPELCTLFLLLCAPCISLVRSPSTHTRLP
jgi:hypothetical protein